MTALVPAPTAPRRFRKKPVIIEAMLWTGDNEDAVRAWAGEPIFPKCARSWTPDTAPASIWNSKESQWIRLAVGCWIIKGVAGEFYPCASDVFETTYEPMTAPASDDTRDRAHPATDVMREAEAWMAYLRQYVVNNPDRDLETAVDGIAAVIRALLEQVKKLEETIELIPGQIRPAWEKDQARIAAHEADLKKHDLLFQSLTPGGSEFVNDPERCVAFAKHVREQTHQLLVQSKADLARLRAERDRERFVPTKAEGDLAIKLMDALTDLEQMRAERDIWRDRLLVLGDGVLNGSQELEVNATDPTPAEIAARVEQNRKEQE